MIKSIKRFAKWALPLSWWHKIRYFFRSSIDRRYWHLTGVPGNRRSDRKSLKRYDIQEGCFVETYWVDQVSSDGTKEFGPAAIVVVHDSEILKFDCYGTLNAHYHIAIPYPRGIRNGFNCRMRWTEKTVEQQVDRSIFELQRNLKSYLLTHPRRKIRKTYIDMEQLGVACERIKAKMLADEMRYGNHRRRTLEKTIKA